MYIFSIIFMVIISFNANASGFFNCIETNSYYDLWNHSDLCYLLGDPQKEVIVINEFNNTKVNRNLLYALYSDSVFKNLSIGKSVSAYRGKDYNLIILGKFGEKRKIDIPLEKQKEFLALHELGHILLTQDFKVKSLSDRIKMETVSDVFALLMMEADENTIRKVKKFRIKEAVEEKELTHYSVMGLNLLLAKIKNSEINKNFNIEALKIAEESLKKDVLSPLRNILEARIKACINKEDALFACKQSYYDVVFKWSTSVPKSQHKTTPEEWRDLALIKLKSLPVLKFSDFSTVDKHLYLNFLKDEMLKKN